MGNNNTGEENYSYTDMANDANEAMATKKFWKIRDNIYFQKYLKIKNRDDTEQNQIISIFDLFKHITPIDYFHNFEFIMRRTLNLNVDYYNKVVLEDLFDNLKEFQYENMYKKFPAMA